LGLLELKDGVDALYATPLDIVEGAKVEVVPVSAEQTPRALDDPEIAASIINNNYALDANLDPKEAIGSDDPSAPGTGPFINVWAGKPEIASNPVIAKLLELADQQDFKDALLKQSKDSAVLADKTQEELLEILDDVESQIKSRS
jgi:D-methionine transport system substrate-binding protein